jgi:RNA polymerase sigma-70 factor (ECF subfamily)
VLRRLAWWYSRRRFADDVVIWADGGGQVKSALRPIIGPAKAARFLANPAAATV